MRIISTDEVARIDSYKTTQGKEFNIARKPHPGRRCQKPKCTGEKLECPYCGDVHDVYSYKVRRGQKGERTLKSWECDLIGKMPLNHGERFQNYIEGIIIRSEGNLKEIQKREGLKKVRSISQKNPVNESRLSMRVKSQRRTLTDIVQERVQEGQRPRSPKRRVQVR